MKKFLKNLKNKYIPIFLIIVSIIIILVSYYIAEQINCSSFEQLLYTINTVEGASMQPVYEGAVFVSVRLIGVVAAVLLIRFLIKRKYTFKLNDVYLTINNRSIKIFPFSRLFVSIVVLILSLLYVFYAFKFNEYIDMQFNKAEIFEKEYVNPKDVKITFPEKKRNLIYIYVESLENSALSTTHGGVEKTSYIPNLEKLALENTNFSNSQTLGGGYATYGSTWTIAGMISQSAGIPLKVSASKANSYTSNNYMTGAYSLGDVLRDNGYRNYFILGEESSFAGADAYYSQHGSYEIYDINWAKKEKLIPQDYYEWWGFEDSKLFEFSKKKLLEISESDEPFNFVMETMDTHFMDGYVDKSCKTKFKENYANAYYCSDQLISEFVKWVQEQDFYENTTIVISGDHLTMRKGFFVSTDTTYERTVYNVFINPAKEAQYNKNRKFNTIDMYPTTLASLGAEIEGDRLGLGTNLFSDKKTLIERTSLDYVESELAKTSDFYNDKILMDDSTNVKQQKENEIHE